MMRLSGSVKFFWAFASGSAEGGAAFGPGFLRPSASRFSAASASALSLASAAAFASASNSALTLLLEKGLIDAAAVDAVIDQFEHKLGPKVGAAAVAKAWADPAFKRALMEDAAKALASI